MTRPTTVIALALTLAACNTGSGEQPTNAAVDKGDKAKKAAPGDAALEAKAEPKPKAEPAAPAGEPPLVDGRPAWYSTDLIAHDKVVRDSQSETLSGGGGLASMMLLELAAGTTPETCMSQIRERIGKDLDQVPEPTQDPDGRLTLRGESKLGYTYTAVCGEAKGTPTVFVQIQSPTP